VAGERNPVNIPPKPLKGREPQTFLQNTQRMRGHQGSPLRVLTIMGTKNHPLFSCRKKARKKKVEPENWGEKRTYVHNGGECEKDKQPFIHAEEKQQVFFGS